MNVLALAAAAFQESPYPSSEGGGAIAALFGGVFALIWLAVVLLVIVSLWKIFEKAGKPGWAAIVPIYNLVVLLEIIRKPIWWIVLFLVPCLNLVAAVMVSLELAKCFGKTVGFAIGMILLPFVFFPMLAFSDAQYNPPAA
jgi:hypothetical protein